MNLSELKLLLKQHSELQLQLVLPAGTQVPQSFHVTEVGKINKTFIDCGGTLRETQTCQLQVWVGEDQDHRLAAGKTAKILDKAASFLTDESVPVEIEYEELTISQYTISSYSINELALILHLAAKHTDCLAKELCGTPTASKPKSKLSVQSSCCSSKSNCCS